MDTLRELFVRSLNMAVAASWLVLALLLLRPLLKKFAPKWVLCALWVLVAVRLVCPVMLHSNLSAYRLAGDAVQEDGQVVYFRSYSDTGHTVVGYDPATLLPHTALPDAESETEAAVPEKETPSGHRDFSQRNISLLWAVGVGVMLACAFVGYVRLKEKVSARIYLQDNVYLCDEVKSPFLLGVFRPHIYLPSGMEEDARSCVLLHERAHLRRGDHIWKLLGYVLLAVYWYNPLIWAAYICFCRDMELACDERVVRDMAAEEKAAYSQTLLDCSRPKRWVSACPLAFGEVGVKTRIKSVLHYKKPAFWAVMAAVLVCIVLAVCFLTDPKAGEQDDSPNIDSTLSHLAETAYQTGTVTLTWHEAGIEVNDDTVPGAVLGELLDSAQWTYTNDSDPEDGSDSEWDMVVQVNETALLWFYPGAPASGVKIQDGNTVRWYSMGDMTCADVLLKLGPSRSYLGQAGQTKEVYTFGRYEQDGDTANGAEPIEWLVLDRDSIRVLLISRYALDFQSYTSFYQPVEENACWKDCSLRGWLNDAFFNTAFTPEEQQKIVVTNTTIPYSDTFIPGGTEDRVFLLTKEDVRYYMTSTEDAQVTPTAYARAQLPDYQTDTGATVTWWLRSDLNNHASVVLWDGRTNDSMRSYEPAYVRPVIWLAMNP